MITVSVEVGLRGMTTTRKALEGAHKGDTYSLALSLSGGRLAGQKHGLYAGTKVRHVDIVEERNHVENLFCTNSRFSGKMRNHRITGTRPDRGLELAL